MTFALTAVAAIVWSLLALRWSFSRSRSPWRRRLIGASIIAVAIAAFSVTADVRVLMHRLRARDSGVTIAIDDVHGWWRIEYTRGSSRFITANEVHVPAGELVTIDWRGRRAASFANSFIVLDGRSLFVATQEPSVDHVRVIRLWPPSIRPLTIVAERAADFDRWFARQQQPARRDTTSPLFVSAGCSFCHALRGVSDEPDSEAPAAPDLTHFGERLTIAATTMPNRPGFLGGWIVDSQSLKSSSLMPPNRLDSPVLHQLMRYLESLK